MAEVTSKLKAGEVAVYLLPLLQIHLSQSSFVVASGGLMQQTDEITFILLPIRTVFYTDRRKFSSDALKRLKPTSKPWYLGKILFDSVGDMGFFCRQHDQLFSRQQFWHKLR